MDNAELWFKRNARGEEAEKEGRFEDAVEQYEANVAEEAETIFSYERLAHIYRTRGEYDNEVRVLVKAINVLRRKKPTPKLKEMHADQLRLLRERLRQAQELRKTRAARRPAVSAQRTPSEKGCLGMVLLVVSSLVLALL